MEMKKGNLEQKLTQNSCRFARKVYPPRLKTLKYVITLIVFFASTGLLFAADSADNLERKPKIVIYNFQRIKQAPAEAGKSPKGKKQKDFSFYSIILPETISKKLQESDRFSISRSKKYLLTDEPESIDIIKDSHSEELISAAKQTSSDYIITGQFEVKDNILNVRIFIYNAILNELQEAATSEAETGIYLKDTPDSLSESIEERIKDIIVEQIEKDTKPPLPNLANFASIGFDAGYLYLSGGWSNLFDNTQYYSPYIALSAASFLDLIFKFDHFVADSKDSIYSNDFSISVLGGSALLGLKYQVFSNLGIYLHAGGGMTRIEFSEDAEPPFTKSSPVKKTTDPAAEVGLGIKINISSLYLRSGAIFKRVFCEGEELDLRIIYGGAGIHF